MGLSASPDGGELDGKELAGGVDLCVAEDVLEVDLADGSTQVRLDEGNADLSAPAHDFDGVDVEVEVSVATQRALAAWCAHKLATVEVRVEQAHVEWVRGVQGWVGEGQSDGDEAKA